MLPTPDAKAPPPRSKKLLASGHRVIAIDPFYFGESQITQRGYLYALLVATTGARPLGLQASQIAAAARWAKTKFPGGPVSVHSVGPRLGVAALVAAALEPGSISKLTQVQPLATLHQVIDENRTLDATPELFCFGLLEAFDIPQLRELVGAARLP